MGNLMNIFFHETDILTMIWKTHFSYNWQNFNGTYDWTHWNGDEAVDTQSIFTAHKQNTEF